MNTSHPFEPPALPWPENALEPVISARTIALHYGKHHMGYVKKLNELVAGTRFAELPLEQVIAATVGNAETAKIFNNAAQAWNHAFFWQSLRGGGGGVPPRAIAQLIEQSFGGYAQFREKFAQVAVDQFGSGWAWLVARDGKLEILSTPNAQTPITMGAMPLLTIDVWEHAYYLDYENRRPEFVEAVIDKLLDWNFAHEQLGKTDLRKAA
ncbi:MAG TPA: superoxide dismutase [Usitatibacter sp.]|nr:superoxide dismutase [Usitatibacter sp.]